MSDTVPLHRVTIEGELTAELREMTAEEITSLIKMTASSPSAGWDLTQHGVARSLVRFGDRTFKSAELAPSGMLEKVVTKAKHLLKLRAAWERLHLPGDEDAADIKAMRVVTG